MKTIRKLLLCGVALSAFGFGYKYLEFKARGTLYPQPVVKNEVMKQQGLRAYVPPVLPIQNPKEYRNVDDILLSCRGGTEQEKLQLKELLTIISKTDTGAHYIGNFPKTYGLAISEETSSVRPITRKNKVFLISPHLFSHESRADQIWCLSHGLIASVCFVNDPGYAEVNCSFWGWEHQLDINQEYPARIAKEIVNESSYGNQSELMKIGLKEIVHSVRYPLPSKEELATAVATTANAVATTANAAATTSKTVSRILWKHLLSCLLTLIVGWKTLKACSDD